MKKINFVAALAAASTLMAVWGSAIATPYGLVGWYQRSSGGVLSSLLFRAGAAQGCPNDPDPNNPPYKQPCYNPANPFVSSNGIVAAVSAAAPTWDWNSGTSTLTETGLFWATSAISSSPQGATVVSDKINNGSVVVAATPTVTASTYDCIEGTFLKTVGANACRNVNLGSNFVLNTATTWNALGNGAKCVTETISPDDFSLLDGVQSPYSAGTPVPRGLDTLAANAAGAGCAQTGGAWHFTNIIQDNATYLIIADVATISNTTNPSKPYDPNDPNYDPNNPNAIDPNSPVGDGCYLFGTGATSACGVDLSLASNSYLVLSPDSDGDGIPDTRDNCKLTANGYTGTSTLFQRDTNSDGFGSICDADLNQSGLTTTSDYTILRNVLNTADANADLNGSGLVTTSDYTILRNRLNTAPGPSGMPCVVGAGGTVGSCPRW